ncbi:MAG: GGDEF domain-containing protein [Clostridiales bacterium]|nr:GGDEF domain-containing protein [Clostridiales bacterium]
MNKYFENYDDDSREMLNQISILKILLVIFFCTRLFYALCFALIWPSVYTVILHLLGSLVYLLAYVLNGLKRYKAIVVAAAVETVICAAASDFTLGPYAQFHMFILTVMIPVLSVFRLKTSERVGITAFLVISMPLCVLAPFLNPVPPPDIKFLAVVEIVNTVIIFGTLAAEFILYKNIERFTSSELRKDYERVRAMAYEDSLTKLKTRQYAKQYFALLAVRQTDERPTCFAMLDIDFFKHVNDTYGHDAGDRILEFVASILKQSFRSTDLVCRWGGEEFLVVMENCPLDIAVRLLDKVRAKAEESAYQYNDKEINLTVTIGVTTLVNCDVEGAILRSDKMLYKGKVNGRNQVVSSA